MTPVAREAIVDLETYAAERETLRPVVLAARRLRTVQVGRYLVFQFENRLTVRYQVQEMLRVERITGEAEIVHELETYNDILGGEGELGCTLLIGIDDPGLRDELLARWLELPQTFYLRTASGRKVRASWDANQVGEDRLSSVQFLKFDTGGEAPVALGCDHPDPEVNGETPLSEAAREALAADLEDRDLLPDPAAVPALVRAPSGPQVGAPAPGFVLLDSERQPVSLAELRGQRVVLAFFPAAFTGVCTAEVCALQDRMARLSELDARVLGISVDAPFALAAFARQHGLGFPLLSDYGRRVTRAYDVALNDFAGMQGYTAAQRAVFIVDRRGRVAWRWVADSPGTEPDYDAVEAALAEVD